jgi:hypothetical protein
MSVLGIYHEIIYIYVCMILLFFHGILWEIHRGILSVNFLENDSGN